MTEAPNRAKESQQQSDRPARHRFFIEDYYGEELDRDVVRVREAIGIDDDAFCRVIAGRRYQVTAGEPYGDKADFNFMLSVLKDLRPVDKIHAMLAVNVVISQLALMRVGESLLKPITFELPAELILACHHAHWDLSRLDKQKIQIDDQPVREWSARNTRERILERRRLQDFLREARALIKSIP
jgi:hypothetical protein